MAVKTAADRGLEQLAVRERAGAPSRACACCSCFCVFFVPRTGNVQQLSRNPFSSPVPPSRPALRCLLLLFRRRSSAEGQKPRTTSAAPTRRTRSDRRRAAGALTPAFIYAVLLIGRLETLPSPVPQVCCLLMPHHRRSPPPPLQELARFRKEYDKLHTTVSHIQGEFGKMMALGKRVGDELTEAAAAPPAGRAGASFP